jgi:hypothetical protein
MKEKSIGPWLMTGLILAIPVLALSQTSQQSRTLVVNGLTGQVNVMQINGRSYVDLETLARIANGTLGFQGNQITLTLPGAGPAAAAPAPAPPPAKRGFSKEFLRAGIEEMTSIREWRIALTNAIQRGYPVTEDWIAGYQGEASQNLRLASVAVATDSDRNAMQLLTNEFNNMKKLSDRFVQANKNMNYVAPDALNNDPLDQKILACAHSLASMASSGQFVDDGSCQ